jgi:cytochrome c oxidase cbb3-type subunit 2
VNFGPIIFLVTFFAMAGSWFGLVLTPQMQLGHLQQTNSVAGSGALYPVSRPGLARQGLDVYRSLGCAYCHSQQVRQSGTVCDVYLNDPGTNRAAVLAAISQVNPNASESQAREMLTNSTVPILTGVTRQVADTAVKALSVGGAKPALTIVPIGPDITQGWGKRQSVAEDTLYDYPVMLGSQRIGPDLANEGLRRPDLNWHLRHLYAPRLETKGSGMPPYRFLFTKQKIGRAPSPEALALKEFGPPAGYEIVPTPAAAALAAYLQSLRTDVPLAVAPFSMPEAPAPADTNAPPTNAGPAGVAALKTAAK